MSLEIPINHSCNIKCPNCGHQFLYNFKIKDIEEISSRKRSQVTETQYKFMTYLICKNPLCNYDIEIAGDVLEHPVDTLNTIDITFIK